MTDSFAAWINPEQAIADHDADIREPLLARIAELEGQVAGNATIAKVLQQHQMTTGMQVAMGVTCRCGYWNGVEVAGQTRPIGLSSLAWHQAQEIAQALAIPVEPMKESE